MKKNLKPVNKEKNPGLAKLPTAVRNKMGFMKKGGVVKGNINRKMKDIGKEFFSDKEVSKIMSERNKKTGMKTRSPGQTGRRVAIKKAKGGMVSRGQYDAQVKKIKFKGVF